MIVHVYVTSLIVLRRWHSAQFRDVNGALLRLTRVDWSACYPAILFGITECV